MGVYIGVGNWFMMIFNLFRAGDRGLGLSRMSTPTLIRLSLRAFEVLTATLLLYIVIETATQHLYLVGGGCGVSC